MTTTPDPVDALKYALTIVANRLDGAEDFEDVVEAVMAASAPFVDVDASLDGLRYTDGSFVTVTSEYAPGRALMNHFLPPGYPPSDSRGRAADR